MYLPPAEAHRCLSLLGGRWLLPWSVTYLFLIKSERKNKLLQCKLVDEISPLRTPWPRGRKSFIKQSLLVKTTIANPNPHLPPHFTGEQTAPQRSSNQNVMRARTQSRTDNPGRPVFPSHKAASAWLWGPRNPRSRPTFMPLVGEAGL